jgi:hypothetical protein
VTRFSYEFWKHRVQEVLLRLVRVGRTRIAGKLVGREVRGCRDAITLTVLRARRIASGFANITGRRSENKDGN